MVLTRAQAATQAAAFAAARVQGTPNVSNAIVELPSDNGSPATTSAVAEYAPRAEDHLAKIAEYFLAQTQSLAAEHMALLCQQQGQSNAQSAALTAVQASTENSVKKLNDQQLEIAERLGEALTATQSGLQEQFQRLQLMQDERGLQIEQAVNDRLSRALKQMEDELNQSWQRIAIRSDGVDQRFESMETKIDGGLQSAMKRVHDLVQEKLASLSHYKPSDEETSHFVRKLVESSLAEVAAEIKRSVNITVQQATMQQKSELMQVVNLVPESVQASIQSQIADAALNVERQLEARMQKAITNTQSELNLQVQRQADATSSLRELFRKQCEREKQSSTAIDETAVRESVKDIVRDEFSQQIDALVAERSRPMSRQESAPVVDYDELNSEIERSLHEGMKKIFDAIKNETSPSHSQTRAPEQPVAVQTSTSEVNEEKTSDREFERVQALWKRTYYTANSASTISPTYANGAEAIPISDDMEEKREPLEFANISDDMPQQQTVETQTCFDDNGDRHQHQGYTETAHMRTILQPHRMQHYTYSQSLKMQILISEIQQEVAERAEQAARRVSSRR